MRKIQYILGVSIASVLVGCGSSSTISPASMKTVKLANGKNYSVPVGSVYTKAAVTPKAVQFYKIMGVSTCKNGDITWEDPIIADRINKIMRGGTKQEGIEMYVKAAKAGEIGCSSPLN